MKPKRYLHDNGESHIQNLYNELTNWAEKHGAMNPYLHGYFRHTSEENMGQEVLEKVWGWVEREA